LIFVRSLDYETYSYIADKIVQDSSSLDYNIVVYDHKNFGWNDPGMWYFLKNKLNVKLLFVVNFGNNLKPMYSDKSAYLVCTPFNQDAQCKNVFNRKYQNHILQTQLEIEYPEYAFYKYTKKEFE